MNKLLIKWLINNSQEGSLELKNKKKWNAELEQQMKLNNTLIDLDYLL